MGDRRQDALLSPRAGGDGCGRWRRRSLDLAEGENAVRRSVPPRLRADALRRRARRPPPDGQARRCRWPGGCQAARRGAELVRGVTPACAAEVKTIASKRAVAILTFASWEPCQDCVAGWWKRDCCRSTGRFAN